jgi:hypothetical protein
VKFCPNCGTELGSGVTRCHNKKCSLVLSEPNDPNNPIGPVPITPRLAELQAKLEDLRQWYSLSGTALGKGKIAAIYLTIRNLPCFRRYHFCPRATRRAGVYRESTRCCYWHNRSGHDSLFCSRVWSGSGPEGRNRKRAPEDRNAIRSRRPQMIPHWHFKNARGLGETLAPCRVGLLR